MQGARIAPSAILAMLVAVPAACSAEGVPGTAPRYTSRSLSEVPNAAAMSVRIWAPGLNDGYVPQGVAVIGADLYVSAYKSADRKQDRGPCRVYRLDPRDGTVTGQLDLPETCGHAGGLAKGPAGFLFVADTHIVFELVLGEGSDQRIGRVGRSIRLTGNVKGSFAAGAADALWLGTYAKNEGARLFWFPFAGLKAELADGDAAGSIALPSHAQGAAFGPDGDVWVSRSGSRFGELLRLDPKTGGVRARYPMPAGIEDLSFDEEGRIWALSEAGSQRWIGWPTFFPVVFRLEPAQLR